MKIEWIQITEHARPGPEGLRLTYEGSIDGEEREEVEVALPTRAEVCPRCHGKGVHDHPAFSNGITESEWAEWGDEEQQAYRAGRYDVTCTVCHGRNVVWRLDTEACRSPLEQALAKEHTEDEERRAQLDAEDAHTRRMESGGY